MGCRRGPGRGIGRCRTQSAAEGGARRVGLLVVLALSLCVPAKAGLRVSPLSIDFGSQRVGGEGVDGQVSIENMTSTAVLVSSVQSTGTDPGDFIPRSDPFFPCGMLAPGMSCTTHVIFAPSAPGPRSAELEIFTDAAGPITVSLRGKGIIGTPPTITCPDGVTVSAPAGQSTAFAAIGMATATGDGVIVTGTRSDGGSLGDPYPIGVTIITWSATDRNQNTITCTESVTVQALNRSLPIQCPPGVAVGLDGGNTAAAVSPGVATSSAAGATIVGVRSDGQALNAPYPEGTTTITWTATDAAGNEGTCVQTITVGSGSGGLGGAGSVDDTSRADPHVDTLAPAQGPLYQKTILHGSGFADFQGTSYVLLGGRRVTVLAWSDSAIGLLINPLAYNPAPLAIDAAYPVQVVTPNSGAQSNTIPFFLTDAPPARHPRTGAPPQFAAFQQTHFCPGDTVVFLGSNLGPAQGAGYLAVTIPLADPSGNVVQQPFVLPVLSWNDQAIRFALSLPTGAIPGTYLATVHRSDGETASGSFTVAAPSGNGGCQTGG